MAIDLSTTYLGLSLRSPLVPSASPLSDELDAIRRLEDAGASAVVLHSLFEEQLRLERYELNYHLTQSTNSHPEALSYFPSSNEFVLGPEEYLEHIHKAKEAVSIPIIASLNGMSVGGWTRYAQRIEQAGADALELNVYSIPTELDRPGSELDQDVVDILKAVKESVKMPVAVKLSPYYSNLAHLAKRLANAGANGLVLFNRFYQPDIDLETLEVKPNILLSTPQAMRLPLTWIGILYGRVPLDLAATSGIHTAEDALKMLMAGAKVTMLCSVLFKKGFSHLRLLKHDIVRWLEEHEYESIRQLQGSMSQKNCPDPTAFERAQYMRAVQSLKRPEPS